MSNKKAPWKRFGLLKKKLQNQQSEQFDENAFDFWLQGDPYTSSLIQAAATLKNGENQGIPIPLNCTWYRSNNEQQFIPIESAQGAFYMPTVDDLGWNICVHAIPVSEVEPYTGMPAFQEIGPIQLSPEIQEQVDLCMTEMQATIPAVVLESQDNGVNDQDSVFVSVDQNGVKIEKNEVGVVIESRFAGKYPNIILCKENDKVLIMELKEDLRIKIELENCLSRDLLTMVIRGICGKSQLSQDMEGFLKIQQLNDQLQDALQNNKELQEQINKYKAQLENSQREMGGLIDFKDQTTVIIEKLTSDIENSSQQIQELNDHESFLKQDANLYKKQWEKSQAKLEQFENESKIKDNKLRNLCGFLKQVYDKIINCERCLTLQDDLQYFINDLKEFDDANNIYIMIQKSNLNEVINQKHEEKIKQYEKDIKNLQDQIEICQQEKLEIQEKWKIEVKHYKKRLESLSYDNDRLLSKIGKNPKDISEFEKEKQDFETAKEKILNQLEQEQEKANAYRINMELAQKRLSEEISKNIEIRKQIKHSISTTSSDNYQQVINSISVALTDKSQELDEMKQVNKQLAQRLVELERKLQNS